MWNSTSQQPYSNVGATPEVQAADGSAWQHPSTGYDAGHAAQSGDVSLLEPSEVGAFEPKPHEYTRLDQTPIDSQDGRAAPSGESRRGIWGACKDWGAEFGAAIFSLCCLMAVIGVLAVEDGRTLDQWSWSVGPTAVVAFLGTLAKMFLLVAVSESISQLKWQHYENKTNALGDLQLFDSASRGPLGSIRLVIFKNVKSILASVAAVVVIAAVLLDPFMQLVFSFPSITKPDPSMVGTFQTTHSYDPTGKYVNSHMTDYSAYAVDTSMQAAIIGAVSGSARSLSASCTTGNCTWTNLTTLGVCSSCSDITSQVTVKCPSNSSTTRCYYYMPSGAILQGSMFEAGATGDYFPTLWNSTYVDETTSGYGGNATLATFEAVQLLADFDYSTFNMTSIIGVPTAWKCAFELCAWTIQSVNMTNGDVALYGQGQEGLLMVNETKIQTEANSAGGISTIQGLQPTSSDDTYWINQADYASLSAYLEDLFTSGWGLSGFGASSSGVVPNLGQWFTDADIGNTTNNIAYAMTQVMRTSRNSTSTDGVVYRTRTYIHVQWAWLALPIALPVLSLLMVIVMVFKSSRSGLPAWKGSNLALLYHRVDGWAPPRAPTGDFRDNPKDLKKQIMNIPVALPGHTDKMAFVTTHDDLQQGQQIR